MRTRLLAFIGLILLLCGMPAHAQTGTIKTPTQLNTEINQLFPDQNSGLLTPFNTRQTLLDLVASNGAIANPTPNTLNQAINITQSPAGSNAANTNFNTITLSDTATITGGFFGNGLTITDNFGGSSVQGGRQVIIASAALNATTSASNTNRNYVGLVGVGQAIANDNGTSPTFANGAGGIFGGNFIGVLGNSAATSLLNVTGAEFNLRMVTGSSAAAKSLAQFSADPLDRVQGSVVDAMLWLYDQSASNPHWNSGILFDGANQIWPIKSTGTIIQTAGAGTAAHGIDFSNTTFSTDAYKSNGFAVAPTGGISSGFASVASGSLTLTGLTSGSTIINVTSTGILQFASANGGINILPGGGNSGLIVLNGVTSGFAEIAASATGGHLTYATSGAAPTNNACTGFALATGSTDIAGRVTFTSATSCAINFGTAFGTAPFCEASGATGPSTVQVATTTAVLTVTFGTAQTSMSWVCYGV